MNTASGSNPADTSFQVSFADYLELLQSDLPVQLVSESSFMRIRDLASRLPGFLAFSSFGFECPLGTAQGDADFLFSLQKKNAGPALLAGQLEGRDFDGSLLAIPQWQQVRRFGMWWAEPPSPLVAGIDDVWMEFDIATASALQNVKAPSLFFAPFLSLQSSPGSAQDDRETWLLLLTTAFRKLNERSPSDVCIDNWRRCLDILPGATNLFQVGMMIARPGSEMLRTCISVENRHVLRNVLNKMEWPGNYRNLDPMLEKISTLFDGFNLHLDLGETTSGKIGIECMFPCRKGPQQEPRWFPFLDLLEAEGLCRPDKRDALLSYPGYRETDLQACPAPLKAVACRHFPLYRSFFVRTVYHIKLVLDSSGTWTAKAYLGVNHFWKGIMEGKEPAGLIG